MLSLSRHGRAYLSNWFPTCSISAIRWVHLLHGSQWMSFFFTHRVALCINGMLVRVNSDRYTWYTNQNNPPLYFCTKLHVYLMPLGPWWKRFANQRSYFRGEVAGWEVHVLLKVTHSQILSSSNHTIAFSSNLERNHCKVAACDKIFYCLVGDYYTQFIDILCEILCRLITLLCTIQGRCLSCLAFIQKQPSKNA